MPRLASDSSTDAPIQCLGQGATQYLTAGAESSVNEVDFSGDTTVIRIIAVEAAIYYRIGPGTPDAASGSYLPAGVPEYRRIDKGDKIAVVSYSGDDVEVVVEECK